MKDKDKIGKVVDNRPAAHHIKSPGTVPSTGTAPNHAKKTAGKSSSK